MMQVGTNQSTTYHSQPSLSTAGGQTGRSSSTSRQQQQQQQQQSQYDNDQAANIRPRLCTLRKWPHYDGKTRENLIDKVFDEFVRRLWSSSSS